MSELKIAIALAAFISLTGAGISLYLYNRRGWLYWLPDASFSLWLFSLLFRL